MSFRMVYTLISIGLGIFWGFVVLLIWQSVEASLAVVAIISIPGSIIMPKLVNRLAGS